MAETSRRVANRIIRLYPRPWRRRYGAEMQAILDEIPIRWSQVADLARGAVREWLSPRAFGWPARSAAGRIQFARGLKYFTVAYAIDGLGRVLAAEVSASNAGLPSWFATAAEWGFYAGASRFILASTLTWRKSWSARFPRASRATGLEIAFWCLPLFAWSLFKHTQPIPPWVSNVTVHEIGEWSQPYVWALLTLQVSEITRRLRLVQYPHLRRRTTNN